MNTSNPYVTRVTILAVDDSTDDMLFLEKAFQSCQFNVDFHGVSKGEDAIIFLADPSKPLPDMILLDLNMPGMGGHATLEVIKKHPKWCNIPTIVLTTSDHKQDITSSYRSHANSYIKKPLQFEALIEIIARLGLFWFSVAIPPVYDSES